VPSFIKWLPRQRLNSAAREVLSSIEYIKLRAVKENANMAIAFNPASENYTVFLDNGAGANAGNGVLDSDEVVVKRVQMPAGVNLKNTTFPVNTLKFDRRGLPNGVSGSTSLMNSLGEIKSITVNIAGNSKII
jgi:Tfp pilus assembly protein FimT